MPFDIFGKLKELGYETCPENFYSHISKWKEWYDGDVKTFHHYQVYNGQKTLHCDRYGLGMAQCRLTTPPANEPFVHSALDAPTGVLLIP